MINTPLFFGMLCLNILPLIVEHVKRHFLFCLKSKFTTVYVARYVKTTKTLKIYFCLSVLKENYLKFCRLTVLKTSHKSVSTCVVWNKIFCIFGYFKLNYFV